MTACDIQKARPVTHDDDCSSTYKSDLRAILEERNPRFPYGDLQAELGAQRVLPRKWEQRK